MKFYKNYDVIVVGGGHAGTEAALASARIGAKTLLLTHNIDTLGQMSCNPSIGGIGKGHLVKEIDALGGIMARAADYSGIQFRVLNARKGAAVRATRVQTDRMLYKKYIREQLETQENLQILQQAVGDLIIENDTVIGVIAEIGIRFYAKSVILTVGTFLAGKIHIGLSNYPGGRAGDLPSQILADKLYKYDFKIGRLKTGTPPRIDKRTVDFNKMIEQPGDTPTPTFSFLENHNQQPTQVSCWITETNSTTHEIITSGMKRSPLFTGAIKGNGPRYCPSIEDKIVRFADKNSHQIFVEPESLSTNELYPNGIFTSLPFDIQLDLIHSIKGFENAFITRAGYAIEYNYFNPQGLNLTLETNNINNLFFAGQINGTTGYEEAAAQGLLAGYNGGAYALNKPKWYPKRDESYIGVMVDDLTTQGVSEPYRMFTSRAEFRLSLREDNADLRLTEIGYKLGLVDEDRFTQFNQKRGYIEMEITRLKSLWLRIKDIDQTQAKKILGDELHNDIRLWDALKRPNVKYDDVLHLGKHQKIKLNNTVVTQLEIQAKYAGYINRQKKEVTANQSTDRISLEKIKDYSAISGISNELKEKLNTILPSTIGQASRIQGMTPAAISILRIYLRKIQ